MVYTYFEEKAEPAWGVLSEAEPTQLAALFWSQMYFLLLVRGEEYPSHQRRSYVFMTPFRKAKAPILIAKTVFFPPLLPVRNSCTVSTISATTTKT